MSVSVWKVAIPKASVATDRPAAPSVPPGPLLMTAVTCRPLEATGLPAASSTCTAGCCANGIPLGVEADGWVTTVSLLAGPAVRLIAAELTPVRLLPEKAS